MDRREFLGRAVVAVGAALGTPSLAADALSAPTASTQPARKKPLRASDVVALPGTGIRPSRLAIGTGTTSGSEQREVGIDGMVRLLRHGLDAGIRWWDTADMYKIHPHVSAALEEVSRDQVVITSKTQAKDAAGIRADIERFRRELHTDYIDIVLLHCMTEADWPARMRGPMDALSEFKQRGVVRAVGCSCHTFEALQAAAREPWVDVDLARINPFAEKMDVTELPDVPKVVETLMQMHRRGKAVYGMKILGEGSFRRNMIDRSLRFALGLPCLSGFTIGFSSPAQIDDIVQRIDRIGARG